MTCSVFTSHMKGNEFGKYLHERDGVRKSSADEAAGTSETLNPISL